MATQKSNMARRTSHRKERMSHTATPWHLGTRRGKKKKHTRGGGFTFALPPIIEGETRVDDTICMMGAGSVHFANAEENAARIVKCVNAHDELLSALIALVRDTPAIHIPVNKLPTAKFSAFSSSYVNAEQMIRKHADKVGG